MMATKTIKVTVDEQQHERLKAAKGDRTWLEVLEDGAAVGDFDED
jgi:hypothetical protein